MSVYCTLCLPVKFYMLHVYCTFLALVELFKALLLNTCDPKAVGGVCHATNYQLDSQLLVAPLIIQCVDV